MDSTRSGPRYGRRGVLRSALVGAAGLSAAALFGCKTSTSDSVNAKAPPASAPVEVKPQEDVVAMQIAQATADGAPWPYTFAEPAGEVKRGGTLNVYVNQDFTGILDPNKSVTGDTTNIAGLMANRLVGYVAGPKLNKFKVELKPELAKSWEISPDGLTYTFTLEPNVKMINLPPLNGRPLTAKDVVYNYQRAAKGGADFGTANAAAFAGVDSITAPNDTTVVVKWKRPNAEFAFAAGWRGLPIIGPEIYEQGMIDKMPMGSGPAILTFVAKQQGYKFKSNPDYWRGKPYLDGIEFKPIMDADGRTAAFRVGQLDELNAPSLQTARAIKQANPDVQITTNPVTVGNSLLFAFDTRNAKFKDERVRRAVSLAFDREKINQIANLGFGRYSPSFPYGMAMDGQPTAADLGPYWKFDPAQAKQLLVAAGQENLTFEVMIASFTGTSSSFQQAAYPSFKDTAGITVNARILQQNETNVWQTGGRWRDVGGEAISLAAGASRMPNVVGWYYNQLNTKGDSNFAAIRDPQIDDWTEKAVSEINPKARKELLRKVWDRMQDQIFQIDTPQAYGSRMYQKYLRGVRWDGAWISVYEWYDYGYGYEYMWLDK